jgi:hypothetical protein
MSAIVAHGRSADRLILRTAARGAALIGVAVILGIVLLQVVDNSGSPGGGGGSATPTSNGSDSTTTTTIAGQGRPPAEILVQVLNGSGVSMAAQTESNKLRSAGYKVAQPGNFSPERTGSVVQCKEGFEDEAETLAASIGPPAATVEPFPDPAPAGSDATVNCLVILGK